MEKAKIRFNLDFVPVSAIAEQWYCEKAVDLRYRHPNIEFKSPELDFGTAGHELLGSEAEIITQQELKEYIESKKAIRLLEKVFEGAYRNVLIRGMPDYVEIKGRKAIFLLDFKFSKHKHGFPSYQIQTDTYAYLLYKNHYNIDKLFCGIAIFPPNKLNQDDILLDEVDILVKKRLSEMRHKKLDTIPFDSPGLNGYLYSFSLSKAKRNLTWAIDYWRKKRDPIPTKKAYKCRLCSYNAAGLCWVSSAAANKR